jgi:hypothetical protein
MARGANGRFIVRNVENGVPQNPIDVDKAVANYAQAAMNAPDGPAKSFWTAKLWETRNKYGYVTTLPNAPVKHQNVSAR